MRYQYRHLKKISKWFLALVMILPSLLQPFSSFVAFAEEGGNYSAQAVLYDGPDSSASVEAHLSADGTAVNWTVKLEKHETAEELALKLEVDTAGGGLGAPYSVSGNVQLQNTVGAVQLFQKPGFTQAADQVTATFATDIVDASMTEVSLRLLVETVTAETANTVTSGVSANTRTISLSLPVPAVTEPEVDVTQPVEEQQPAEETAPEETALEQELPATEEPVVETAADEATPAAETESTEAEASVPAMEEATPAEELISEKGDKFPKKPKKGTLIIHKVQFTDQDIPKMPERDGMKAEIPWTSPMDGAGFTVYRVKDDETDPMISRKGLYAYDEQHTEDGKVVFDKLPAGRYLVVETDVPYGVNIYNKPFLVDVPMMNPKKDGWLDRVHVYAMNQLILASAEFDKHFEEFDGEGTEATFGIWQLDSAEEEPDGKPFEIDVASPEDPQVYFDNHGKGLETGHYVIKELDVSEPYGLSDEEVHFEVKVYHHDYDLKDGEASIDLNKKVEFKNYLMPMKLEKENLDDDDTADFHENFQWALRTRIPRNIEDYKYFEISDELDPDLDYENDVEFWIDGEQIDNPSELAAIIGPEEGHGGTLWIEFNPSKLADYAGQDLEVRFTTSINEFAEMGEEIVNYFELHFHNGNKEFTKKSNKAVTITGGKRFDKTSVRGLDDYSGADFWIYKDTDSGKRYLQEDMSWLEEGTEGFKAKKFTSAKDGTFEVKGLAFGTYYLHERKALPGHDLRPDLEFTINENSYNMDPEEVMNKPQMELPETGGMGTVVFTIAGMSLMAGAVKMYRKEDNE